MNLSKMSVAGLIPTFVGTCLSEKDLMPYWNSLCLDMSQKLLSHTGPVVSVRIYPKIRHTTRKYLWLSRWWFNRTINYLRQEGTKASLYEVRKIVQKGDDIPDWAMDCPQRIREHAMSDACNAVKNAKAKYLKMGKVQQVSFRAKRDPIQSFGFDKSALNQDVVFGSKKFKLEFEVSEPFHTDLEGTRIVREGSRYFVIIPQKLLYQVPENQRIDAVALDPGVRTFMSFYSEVLHGKIGEGSFQRIYRLCLWLRLMSRISKVKCRQKRRLKQAAERMRWRIWDLINELHKKVANFLVRTFNRIFIPIPTFMGTGSLKLHKWLQNWLQARHVTC